jgi:hypothetical protein
MQSLRAAIEAGTLTEVAAAIEARLAEGDVAPL